MKVKDVRLHYKAWDRLEGVHVYDQDNSFVFCICWGKNHRYTKPQAIALAKRLCDRFNAGQEK